MIESGSRLRYEPIALVAHEHRTQMRDWLGRKAFYGSSAAPLSIRHPDKTAPVVISAWSLLVWLLMAIGSASAIWRPWCSPACTARRMAKAMENTDAGTRDVAVLAAARSRCGGAAVGLRDLPALLAAGAAGRH